MGKYDRMISSNIGNEESQGKFNELENQLKSVISQCKEKNLIDSFGKSLGIDFGLLMHSIGMWKCTNVDVYKVDDLYVYKFFVGNNPVDYIITESPLFEKNKKELMDGFSIEYTGASGVEYSLGGTGYSVGLGNNNTNPYENSPRISALTPNRNGLNCSFVSYKEMPDVIITDDLDRNYRVPSNYRIYGLEMIGTRYNGCSFAEMVNASVPYNNKLSSIKNVLNKVEKIYSQKRSNHLKKLLSTLFNKNSQLGDASSRERMGRR